MRDAPAEAPKTTQQMTTQRGATRVDGLRECSALNLSRNGTRCVISSRAPHPNQER